AFWTRDASGDVFGRSQPSSETAGPVRHAGSARAASAIRKARQRRDMGTSPIVPARQPVERLRIYRGGATSKERSGVRGPVAAGVPLPARLFAAAPRIRASP